MGDDRRGCVVEAALDDDVNAIGSEDLQRRGQRRLRQRVGVHAREERPGDALPDAVFGYGLADGGDVVVVERAARRCAAVAGRAEADRLQRVGRVGMVGIVGRDEPGYVDKPFAWGRLPGQWV